MNTSPLDSTYTILGRRISFELEERIRNEKGKVFASKLVATDSFGRVTEFSSRVGYQYEDFLKENPTFV